MERLKNFLENVFLWRSLEKFLWRPLFFFGEHLCLCPWSLASSIPVLGLESVCPRKGCPWPRIFFCVLGLGLEPCVLDSTSGKKYWSLSLSSTNWFLWDSRGDFRGSGTSILYPKNCSFSLSRSAQWRLGVFGGRVLPNYVQVSCGLRNVQSVQMHRAPPHLGGPPFDLPRAEKIWLWKTIANYDKKFIHLF